MMACDTRINVAPRNGVGSRSEAKTGTKAHPELSANARRGDGCERREGPRPQSRREVGARGMATAAHAEKDDAPVIFTDVVSIGAPWGVQTDDGGDVEGEEGAERGGEPERREIPEGAQR